MSVPGVRTDDDGSVDRPTPFRGEPAGPRAVGDPVDMPAGERLEEAARSATLAQNLACAARLAAAHAMVVEAERDRTCASGGDGGDGRHDDARRYARIDPRSRARDHVAAHMSLTTWHAARLVDAAVEVHRRLPRLRGVVERGALAEGLVVDLACRLREVPDRIVAQVEAEVVRSLVADVEGGDRPSRSALAAEVDRAVERADPQAVDDAVAEAERSRTVSFRPDGRGMTRMWALLRAEEAEVLRARIEAAAGADYEVRFVHDPELTLEQCRADALVAIALGFGNAGSGCAAPASDATGATVSCTAGSGPSDPDAAGSTATAPAPSGPGGGPLHVTVISSSAAGLPDRAEVVRGAYSSLDWLFSTLFGEGRESESGTEQVTRFEVVDLLPGSMDDPDAALRYLISAGLARRIRLRDGTCRHPGCSVPAECCDIDHIVPFDHFRPGLGGPTAEWNLVCLCRGHHREKTFGRWAYRPGELGELVITTESGRQLRTRPRGMLALARRDLLDHRWDRHRAGDGAAPEKWIGDDGLVTSPPGAERTAPTG